MLTRFRHFDFPKCVRGSRLNDRCLLVIVSWAPLTEHLTIELFRSLFNVIEVGLSPAPSQSLPPSELEVDLASLMVHGSDADGGVVGEKLWGVSIAECALSTRTKLHRGPWAPSVIFVAVFVAPWCPGQFYAHATSHFVDRSEMVLPFYPNVFSLILSHFCPVFLSCLFFSLVFVVLVLN